jgi:hypothetical protein
VKNKMKESWISIAFEIGLEKNFLNRDEKKWDERNEKIKKKN